MSSEAEQQSTVTLGATYRDSISGFEGVAVNTTLFLFACERVWLSKGPNEKGEDQGAVFDAVQLVHVKGRSRDVEKALEKMRAQRTMPQPPEPPKRSMFAARTGGDRPAQSAVR